MAILPQQIPPGRRGDVFCPHPLCLTLSAAIARPLCSFKLKRTASGSERAAYPKETAAGRAVSGMAAHEGAALTGLAVTAKRHCHCHEGARSTGMMRRQPFGGDVLVRPGMGTWPRRRTPPSLGSLFAHRRSGAGHTRGCSLPPRRFLRRFAFSMPSCESRGLAPNLPAPLSNPATDRDGCCHRPRAAVELSTLTPDVIASAPARTSAVLVGQMHTSPRPAASVPRMAGPSAAESTADLACHHPRPMS